MAPTIHPCCTCCLRLPSLNPSVRVASARRKRSVIDSFACVQVDGRKYALLECVYVQPWPNALPWVARIEEILPRMGNNNKVQTYLGVRFFYRRHDLLPSAASEYPFCDQPEREVYVARGKLDEVASSTVLGSCSVMAAAEASAESLQQFLEQPDTYFYRYEYSPKRPPLFSLPGGQPLPAGAAPAPPASAPAAAAGGGGGGAAASSAGDGNGSGSAAAAAAATASSSAKSASAPRAAPHRRPPAARPRRRRARVAAEAAAAAAAARRRRRRRSRGVQRRSSGER